MKCAAQGVSRRRPGLIASGLAAALGKARPAMARSVYVCDLVPPVGRPPKCDLVWPSAESRRVLVLGQPAVVVGGMWRLPQNSQVFRRVPCGSNAADERRLRDLHKAGMQDGWR